ncbi:hypothetical protein [Parapedobacter indicus]|uniref:Right handed beta helix region n=1 Tax=Parapedobacter indicus TaxID=1477437 RepID=A0A1I3TE27_9SPHI|nr:hypothetical protein [Parapedobacter indicus]PPK99534.1 hypothetical protein CLV26_11252 [Parapedobacter indicus]SFJ68870.1 hypothetical protein SAMN05444682_112129 [Parapedobacter indicus]
MADLIKKLSRRLFLKGGIGFLTVVPFSITKSNSIYTRLNKTLRAKSQGLKGDGTDETEVLVKLLNKVKNGNIIDFEGLDITIFENIKGEKDKDAIQIENVPRLFNKRNVLLKNGTIRVKNPSAGKTKVNFPTALSLDRCQNITIENFSFYGKGENWGNADASVRLPHNNRAPFLQQNGGHALAIIKCENVKINDCKAFLCGSVASFYSASSNKIYFNDCFSNPASLGYAAFCADGWCGENLKNQIDYYLEFNNCTAHRTEVKGGSSKYCGKAGIVVEDKGMQAVVNGGNYSDMFANGLNKDLGNAFRAGSAHLVVNNAACSNCSTVGFASCSTAHETTLVLNTVKASNIGLTAFITGNESRGNITVVFNSCDIQINNSRIWHQNNIREEYRISSVVANLRTNVKSDITFNNCNVNGSDILAINTEAIYGKLKFENCNIGVNKYLIKSNGWGGVSKDSPEYGLIISGTVEIFDEEGDSPLIYWTNRSGKNIYTWVNVDLSEAEIISHSRKNRRIMEFKDKASGTRNRMLKMPSKLKGALQVN